MEGAFEGRYVGSFHFAHCIIVCEMGLNAWVVQNRNNQLFVYSLILMI